jgi:hypothetical protein
MTDKACPYEEPVAEAARSGKWSSELEAHRNGCLSCAELTLVVAACTTDAEMLEALDAPLPDPSAIWLRALLATRERDYHRATQAIVWVQRAAIAVVLAVGMAFTPGLWRVARSAMAGLDLGSPLADLPRAAGSPLLVVIISMIVLGGLAFMEFTSLSEG